MNKEHLVDYILKELQVIITENNYDEKNVTPETRLFGSGSVIDSLDLVNLIVKVEEFVSSQTNKDIQVVDEEAIIAEGSTPFRNADTLAQTILTKLSAIQ